MLVPCVSRGVSQPKILHVARTQLPARQHGVYNTRCSFLSTFAHKSKNEDQNNSNNNSSTGKSTLVSNKKAPKTLHVGKAQLDEFESQMSSTTQNHVKSHEFYNAPVNPYYSHIVQVNEAELLSISENSPDSVFINFQENHMHAVNNKNFVSLETHMPDEQKSKVVSLSKELQKLHSYAVQPVEDVVVKNYQKLKQLAMESQDKKHMSGKKRNVSEVHVVENVSANFAQKVTSGRGNMDTNEEWQLPTVDGVKALPMYNSNPQFEVPEMNTVAHQYLLDKKEELLKLGDTDGNMEEHGQQQSLEVLMQEQEDALQFLAENLPMSSSFLPPYAATHAPLNTLIDGKEMSKDTISSIMVPHSLLKDCATKMNERNLSMARQLGISSKKIKPVYIPKQTEINHRYNKLLKSVYDLVKETVTNVGFGHIAHVDKYAQLVQELKSSSKSDDLDILQLTKENMEDFAEQVVLPVVSVDGKSDSHLPIAVRQSLSLLRKTFNDLKLVAEPSATSYTLMMTMYSELGMPLCAAELFDEMRESDDTVPDTTSYNVILDVLTKANKVSTACKLFDEMRSTALSFGYGKYPALPPQHAIYRKMERLKQIALSKGRIQGLKSIDFDHTGLMSIAKNLNTGKYVVPFENKDSLIPMPDVVTYTTMIKALGKIGDKSGALHIFNQMRKDKVAPNEITWTSIINVMCENGDFKAGLRLLHDMRTSGTKPSTITYTTMISNAGKNGQVSLSIALLHQMSNDNMALDSMTFASLIRGLAEASSIQEGVRLHQLLVQGKFGHNITATRTTYNALLEAISDPHSWSRLTLPDIALQTGLAIYQEALVSGIFPHPYNERNENGVLDLRPYTRGAVMFPIHFFLNSLVRHVVIEPTNIAEIMKNMKNWGNSKKLRVDNNIPSDLLNPNNGLDQIGKLYNQLYHSNTSKDSDASQLNSMNVNGTTQMYFPRIAIPRKGVLFISSKDLRQEWTSAPKVMKYNSGSSKLKTHNGEEFEGATLNQNEGGMLPMRVYVERVLKHTRPWVHYHTMKSNPNVMVVAANTQYYWANEQRNRKGLGKLIDNNNPNHIHRPQAYTQQFDDTTIPTEESAYIKYGSQNNLLPSLNTIDTVDAVVEPSTLLSQRLRNTQDANKPSAQHIIQEQPQVEAKVALQQQQQQQQQQQTNSQESRRSLQKKALASLKSLADRMKKPN